MDTDLYRKRATQAEQKLALARNELNTRPKYEWFVDQIRKVLKQADGVHPTQLVLQVRQLKEASEKRKKAMRKTMEIPLESVVEWHYSHWEDDEWSAYQGVLKYRKDNFILVELEGVPTVLDGEKVIVREYKEPPETKFFKTIL